MPTPREQIARYSTQLVNTTNSYPTIQQVLNDINLRLPNTIPTTDKINWINDCVREIWRFMASTKLHTTTLTADQAIYAMSTDMAFDKIKSVLVGDSTVQTSTVNYTPYKLVGSDDELIGNNYFDALGGIGVYPVPTTDDAGKPIKIIYEAIAPIATTTNLSSVLQINPEYQGVVKSNLWKNIARTGNNPDIELGNDYEADEKEYMHKIRHDYYQRKAKSSKSKFDRRENWWKG